MYNVDKLENGEWYAQNAETLASAEGASPLEALRILLAEEGNYSDE